MEPDLRCRRIYLIQQARLAASLLTETRLSNRSRGRSDRFMRVSKNLPNSLPMCWASLGHGGRS